MFYHPARRDHGLPHDPLKALVAPRPIGWISALAANGEINLSPYSFFNLVSDRPALVLFSSTGRKDALTFVEETHEFVCNIVTREFAEPMNVTSAPFPRGDNEFVKAGLEMEPSALVKPPRVKGIAAALECRHVSTQNLPAIDGTPGENWLVIGQVMGVYIRDDILRDGLVDTAAMRPVARCGYHDYAAVDAVFQLQRPAGGGGDR